MLRVAGHPASAPSRSAGSGGVPSAGTPRDGLAQPHRAARRCRATPSPSSSTPPSLRTGAWSPGRRRCPCPPPAGPRRLSFSAVLRQAVHASAPDTTACVVDGIDLTHMIDRETQQRADPVGALHVPVGQPAGGRPRRPQRHLVDRGRRTPRRPHQGRLEQRRPRRPAGRRHARTRCAPRCASPTPRRSTRPSRWRIAPAGPGCSGRVLLWVGNYTNYPGRAQGDVHNTTFDETHYDFQGVGEYVDAVAARRQGLRRPEPAGDRAQRAGHGHDGGRGTGQRRPGRRLPRRLGKPQWYLDGKPAGRAGQAALGRHDHQPVAGPLAWSRGPTRTTNPGATTGTTMQVSFARWTPKDHLNIDELVLGPGLQDGQVQRAARHRRPRPGQRPDPVDRRQPGVARHRSVDAAPSPSRCTGSSVGAGWSTPPAVASETLFDYLDPGHPDPASYENEQFPSERPGVVEPQGPRRVPAGRRDGVAADRLLHLRRRGHRRPGDRRATTGTAGSPSDTPGSPRSSRCVAAPSPGRGSPARRVVRRWRSTTHTAGTGSQNLTSRNTSTVDRAEPTPAPGVASAEATVFAVR